jgi:hypothetical protein
MKTDLIEWDPSLLLEVKLNEPDDFLRIKETLTRIGAVAKREGNVLYQSCNILHKQGRYYIVHFKEMFKLDGKYANISFNDLARRNTIAMLLSDWGLLDIVEPDALKDFVEVKEIKILSFTEKKNWDLRAKYNIGNSHGHYYK